MSTDKNTCNCGHHHDESCTCGEDHQMLEDTFPVITLTLEDDSEIHCAVLAKLTIDDKGYVALLPVDEEGEQLDDHPYFYQYSEDEEGNPIIDDIPDEDFLTVADAFDALFDEMEEFDEEDDEEV